MKRNQADSSETTDSEKNLYRHDVQKLKRPALGSEKKKDLYPTDEISEDLINISSNSGSSVNDSSDVSSEKQSVRYRLYSKRDIQIHTKTGDIHMCDETFSEANEDQSETNQKNFLLRVVACIVVIAVIVLIYVVFLSGSYPQKPADDGINIKNLMENIKSKYSTQSELTFRIVKAAIKSAVSIERSTPGILVLLSSAEAKDLSEEFALHIANAISKSSVRIKPNSLKTPEELKKDIDVTINGSLSKNELKAVFVDGLDLLPFEAAMIFHSYCDHENAPFKKALYIMTVSSDERVLPSSDIKKLDALASERLSSVWRNSGEDQVSSLVSRLTGSVAGIKA